MRERDLGVDVIGRRELQLTVEILGCGSMETEALGRYPVVGSVVLVDVDIQRVADGIRDGSGQQELK